MSGTLALGPGAEFDFVRALLARFGDAARGIGDDAGVIDVPPGESVLVSTDVAVDGVHFRRDWLTPCEIGYRAATAALSDLAAMAATPRGIVVALTVPGPWRADAEGVADGLAQAARAGDTVIVGGDVSGGATFSVAVTVIGSAARTLRRTGAKPGDGIWVTGRLGGPAAAVRALQAGASPTPDARERFVAPRARLRESRWLLAHGATAGIDISDGLAADLGHMAAASDVAMLLDMDRVPTVAGVDPTDAAASGEEYELAIAGPMTMDAAEFAREFELPLTRVGTVARGPAGVQALRNGVTVALPRGFDHFAP